MNDWFFKNAIDESSEDSLIGESNAERLKFLPNIDIYGMKPKLLKNVKHFIHQVTKGRYGKRRDSFRCKYQFLSNSF